MALDIEPLAKSIAREATGAAKGHGRDLRGYLNRRSRLIARGLAQLAEEHAAGKITDDDVRFALEELRNSERAALAAVRVTAKAAAQDAINAALAVGIAALGKATRLGL